ncbi:MAG: UDP-N-acetylmuramate dehydrogenase [Flavobacteriales bacterium]|nr:UDP-N-acetylmuramate dehydrogenase [Flavobacteriales bacterium]
MPLLRHADLQPYNTFGIAAKAEALARFATADELRGLLAAPELSAMQRLVLGGGSNILFTRDFDGLVLLNEVPGITVVREDEDHVEVRAGAGVVWHHLVMHCVAQGWGGLENLSLIPGKVGAAPMQNIGAYGVEIKDSFVSLEALRLADGEVVNFGLSECAFGYRESFFKREGRDRFIILSVNFRLTKRAHRIRTDYGNIADELARQYITQPTIKDVSDAVIAIRSSKLPDPAVLGNAGSFFKNPVVESTVAERIKVANPSAPVYSAGPGHSKLAAGWLIEQCGWKGKRLGHCGVHEKQALVLVNHGGATGAEIWDLSDQVLRSVRERFGVELEREVNVV